VLRETGQRPGGSRDWEGLRVLAASTGRCGVLLLRGCAILWGIHVLHTWSFVDDVCFMPGTVRGWCCGAARWCISSSAETSW